jgi:hypothetical protein
MTELHDVLGIRKLRTTACHPRCNSQVEVWHKVLNSLLAKVISDNQKDWPRFVKYVVFAYNTTEHSSTGFTPYYLWYGREASWRIDHILHSKDECIYDAASDYIQDVQAKLDYAYPLVRERLGKCAITQSRWYNKRVKPITFKPLDRVYIYSPKVKPGHSPKWAKSYQDIGVIQHRLNDVTYVVRLERTGRTTTIHVDKMKLVHDWPEALTQPDPSRMPAISEADESDDNN